MGTAPLRIKSENRLPGPTDGSWSGSPTSTSRQSPRRAERRAAIRGTSTMETSSTMTASTSRGSYWSWVKASCPVLGSKPVSSSRWMVEASVEHSSPRRLAARPVGAARAVSSPMASNRASTPRRQVVLPVPGPPVRSITCREAAISTAWRCWGA